MTDDAAKATSRRGLLVGGMALAGAYGGLRFGVPALSERLSDLAFEPLERPGGFRRLETAGRADRSAAGAVDPFIGLTPARGPVAPSCAGLFDGGASDRATDTVPVAYFSDYNCAYCRVLTPRLEALENVRITLHELPILGDGSVLAARAALAAGLQGAQDPFHRALMSMPRPSPAGIARVAEDLGLDPLRLQDDMDAPAVEAALARSDALAVLFGLRATPALVVGRTLVVGAIGRVTLRRLVAREIADGPLPACT